MTALQRATAIVNPQTGRRRASALEALLRTTLERRYDLTIVRSRFPGEARILARDAATRSDIVIAVGGDGTVAEVASGIIDSSAELAIIPTGSTNVVARGLGIPLHPGSAARALLRPTKRRYLDVAVNGDRVTLHMAGSGFDALMMRDARPSLKRFAAWLAYLPAALKHLGNEPWQFRVSVDGRQFEWTARMILVANGSFIINQWFQLGENIKPDDGVLDILVFSPPNRWATLTMLCWTFLGRVTRSRYFAQVSGTNVRIEADPPAPVECDGDFIGVTPIEWRLRPGAVPVVVPSEARSTWLGNQTKMRSAGARDVSKS